MYPKPVPVQGTQSCCGQPCRCLQRDTYDMYEQKTPSFTFRIVEVTWYQYKITPLKENPGNRLMYQLPSKRDFECTPRATHCTDRAQTSRLCPESGRPLPLSTFLLLVGVCANGACTTRYERKSIYLLLLSSH